MENTRELGKEYPPEGEEELIDRILEISRRSMGFKGNQSHPPMRRDQHPKSHGCVKGTLIVDADIPEVMKVGVFKEPKTYDIWIRFSNGTSDSRGNLQSDTVPDVRGMAIALMDVEGEKVLDDPAYQNKQDFVLMNSPVFFIRDVRGYIDFFPIAKAMKEGRIAFNEKGEPTQVPEDLQAQFKAVIEANALQLLGEIMSKKTNSPLEIRYWSATPYKLGDRAIKFSAIPLFAGESFNPETAVDKNNYLREAMTKQLSEGDAVFDLRIQLQTDACEMPVEDPTKEWDERQSPFVKVATILIPQQDFNTEERKQFDERQSFSPWHTLPEHQPLGGVNRARKRIYQELSQFRNERNQSK